jgi:hypothetical protein
MPQCDSSVTYMRAVRPEPSPADLPSVGTAGVSEVSRFSCMKFLDVPWGLRPRRTEQELALTFPTVLPSAHISDPFHRKLRQLRCLRYRFDCYRVERTSPGRELHPLKSSAFHGALFRQLSRTRRRKEATDEDKQVREDRAVYSTGIALSNFCIWHTARATTCCRT